MSVMAVSAVLLSLTLLFRHASPGLQFAEYDTAVVKPEEESLPRSAETAATSAPRAQLRNNDGSEENRKAPREPNGSSDDAVHVETPRPPPPPPPHHVQVQSDEEKGKRRRRRGSFEKLLPPRITLLPPDDWDRVRVAGEEDNSGACPIVNRTMWSIPADFNPDEFCKKYGEVALTPRWRPRLFYGIMFGYEFDMLEVVLHEAYPVVDKFIFAESTVTHSLDTKPTFFHLIREEPRFKPYMSKVVNYTFRPNQKFRSGWDIERKQRKFGLKGAFDSGIRINDILIGNMDLDEPFQATYLMRLKYCKIKTKDFFQFHFRFNLNCLQFTKVSQNQEVNFHWGADSLRIKDLYKMRPKRLYENFTVANFTEEFRAREGYLSWHMSTFGSIKDVMRKLQNSPHRFLSNNTEEKIRQEMEECEYGGDKMWKISQSRSLLPKFIQQNMCHFKRKGWMPGKVADD